MKRSIRSAPSQPPGVPAALQCIPGIMELKARSAEERSVFIKEEAHETQSTPPGGSAPFTEYTRWQGRPLKSHQGALLSSPQVPSDM